MSAPWVQLLFPGGRPLVYGLLLAGRRYATQWTVYQGVTGQGWHEIGFFVEIDPVVLGSGGELVQQRSRLWCTDTLDPVKYISETPGASISLLFTPDEVRVELPDCSSQTVARDGAQFAVDPGLPGMMALIYAAVLPRTPPCGVESLKARLFMLNQLVTVPFVSSPALDLNAEASCWHRTTHQAEVRLDASGLMLEVRVPMYGVDIVVVPNGTPLPSWSSWSEEFAPPTPLCYVPPERPGFRLEDVSVKGPVTPIGATLSIPEEVGTFPAVLFIGGSGTHDRHGFAGEIDIGTHEIMDYLAEHGFMGMRFDSRGAGSTRFGDDVLDRGLLSDIEDARACLDYLCGRPEASGLPPFIVGHSQGGSVALTLALEHEERTGRPMSGVVLMAAIGREIDEVIADQLVVYGATVGLSKEQTDRQVRVIKEAIQLARDGLPWEAGAVPDHLLAIFRTRTWLDGFLRVRAIDLIARVHCPLFICQGGKDFQVSAQRDAERLLEAAHNAGVDCAYALFPDLDHLFKRSRGESTLAEYFDKRPVDPAFLTSVRRWLEGRVDAKS